MNLDPQTAIAAIVPAGAIVIWLVRLEGRINLGESRHADIKESLRTIDKKIDRLMGVE